MRSTMLTLSLLACLGLAPQTLPAQTPPAVAMSAVAAADPSIQLQELVRQFRSNDLAALVRGSLPPTPSARSSRRACRSSSRRTPSTS